LIKDNPSFTIRVGVVNEREYSLSIKNKANNDAVHAMILRDANAEFETYCKDTLGMNLASML
jgi:hypothetical protein